MMDKYIGRLLDNRYEILEIIGTGGMAVVYKARCHRLNRLVAIKILKDDYLEDEDFRRRFHAESQAVAMLSHPNIVSVYDVSTSISMEADYIVMELIEGITLKQYMEKKGVLNWKETLHFAMQIAKALEHAHSRGVVHRDIKPHNVMVLKNGSVKVADFGIARMMSKGDTLTKEALGSVHYISPEQAKGGRVDNRSDIYSLGVVMYEMMSGRPPYEGESPVAVAIQHISGGAVMPSTLNPNIPGGMEQIIMKAMARDIQDRYETATQMLTDMDEFRKDPALLFDYHTPPLDEVTRLKREPLVLEPKTDAERVEERSEARRQSRQAEREVQIKKKDKLSDGRGSRVATAAIIACSVVAIIAIGVFLVILLNGGLTGQNGKTVEIPQLVGKYYDALKAYPGLEIRVENEVYDSDFEVGQIINQVPAYGSSPVKQGSVIHVIVSKGEEPKDILMQNLVDLSKERAMDILDSQSLNLDVQIEEEYHETIIKGNVIRTDPAMDAKLTSGQTVTLYVSLGVEETTAAKDIMPDLVDRPQTYAEAILGGMDMDLDIQIKEEYDETVEKGKVARTEPEADTQLTVGQTVTVYISLGEEEIIEEKKMPNLVGQKLDMAISILQNYGFADPEFENVYSNEAVGIVVGQSEEKNSMIPLTTVVVLQVSMGPEPTTEPPTQGSTLPQDVTKDVVIDLSESIDAENTQILIKRNGQTVYNSKHGPANSTVTIKDQTGSGVVEYEIYIGGATEPTLKEKVTFTTNG